MGYSQNLSIRRAVSYDLDEVALVWHDSALAMDGGPDVPPLETLRSRIDSELRSGWDLYIAVRSERVVGLLALKREEAVLDQIFVAPCEQGTGVGRALLACAKQVMPSGFTLRMAKANEKAKRFYEKEGLRLLRSGTHPWTGVIVQFYGWQS